MVWGVVRVLIISTAFYVGLLLGSSGVAAESAVELVQIERDARQVNCGGSGQYLLVQHQTRDSTIGLSERVD
jgi:hypothetical protein